ncbi:MAG: imidazoleglycerol-phosphate dehydratase HisB, partial [Planctomycetes bacterium]|nr:imidazoleglycerol-phosphate dehydratase HisB [Planctomycetota bacterium]
MATTDAPRVAEVRRETRETRISLRLHLDDPSRTSISTGVGFFDHMLSTLAVHGRLGIELEAQGDLHVDQHHLVEDVGIALGTAVRKALQGDLRIRRFASALIPLDESLARAVVDVSGRAYLHLGAEIARARVGEFDTDLVEEFFRAFVANARINLHLDLLRGTNAHHQIEALFKAAAVA